MNLKIVAAAIALTLEILGGAASSPAQHGTEPANAPAHASGVRSPDLHFPDVPFQDRTGASHTLAELNGHVSVVNFWATWCGPCREEMPRLQRLSDEYTPKGVTFLALSLDNPETQGKIDQVVRKRGFTIPVWTGPTEQLFKGFELGVVVPATLVLDRNGEVVGKIEGETRDKDLRSRLDWVLNGRVGKQPRIVQKNDW